MATNAVPSQTVTPARRRLMIELKKIQEDPPTGICATPKDDDIFKWTALVMGPPKTPFENGAFKLNLTFSEGYPARPPTVRFVSKMFHPNVYQGGHICLDILNINWNPCYDVSYVLMSVQTLLGHPNPASPANGIAASLYKKDREQYNKKVMEIVEKSLAEEEEVHEEPPIFQLPGLEFSPQFQQLINTLQR